jgi:hypothetical protein
MSYLRYLCLPTYIGVQHMVCFSLVVLCFVYPMLPVSLEGTLVDCHWCSISFIK